MSWRRALTHCKLFSGRVHGLALTPLFMAEFRCGVLSEAVPSCSGRHTSAHCSGGLPFRCFHTPARRWQQSSRPVQHAVPQHADAWRQTVTQQQAASCSRRCRRGLAAQAVAAPAEVQTEVEYADGQVVKVRCFR